MRRPLATDTPGALLAAGAALCMAIAAGCAITGRHTAGVVALAAAVILGVLWFRSIADDIAEEIILQILANGGWWSVPQLLQIADGDLDPASIRDRLRSLEAAGRIVSRPATDCRVVSRGDIPTAPTLDETERHWSLPAHYRPPPAARKESA